MRMLELSSSFGSLPSRKCSFSAERAEVICSLNERLCDSFGCSPAEN
ncbi:MAG: hypothetical protein ACTS7D_00290 [Candidatus Hodgkinia cicadicola]